MPSNNHQQHGFVLITSLVFLVVITLLAVTAMNRSTLQERMASNMRDQSRDRQAADAALREAEKKISDSVCNANVKKGNATYVIDNNQANDAEALTPTDNELFENNAAYLNPTNWSGAATYDLIPHLTEQDGEVDRSLQNPPIVNYYIQSVEVNGNDLAPDHRSRCTEVRVRYQITARATQGDRAAAVTQSTYAKHY